MLETVSKPEQNSIHNPCSSVPNEPDLQGPCAQNTRALVFGHVRRGSPVLCSNLLLPHLLHHLPRIAGIGVARDNDSVAVHGGSIVIVISFSSFDSLDVFRVYEVFGFLEVLFGLVVVTNPAVYKSESPSLKIFSFFSLLISSFFLSFFLFSSPSSFFRKFKGKSKPLRLFVMVTAVVRHCVSNSSNGTLRTSSMDDSP